MSSWRKSIPRDGHGQSLPRKTDSYIPMGELLSKLKRQKYSSTQTLRNIEFDHEKIRLDHEAQRYEVRALTRHRLLRKR